VPGLSPKIIPKNLTNCMRTGKQKDKKLANRNKSAWGFFYATTQPSSTSETAGAFKFCSARDPIASPVLKSLEAACPEQNT